MSAFAFVNYARFLEDSSTPTVYAYQNFSVNLTRVYSGVAYSFLPFAVSTGAGSKGGDRSEAVLGAATNEISVNIFAEAVQSRWLLDLKTVSLDVTDFSDVALIRSELWRVASYDMDTEKVMLKLTSPLDAVASDVPRRVLNTKIVGALPTSGSLVVG